MLLRVLVVPFVLVAVVQTLCYFIGKSARSAMGLREFVGGITSIGEHGATY